MRTRRELAADLRALGVEPGDVVMAHASVRAIGEVAGGPDEIHWAITDAVGPSGTLFMYAGVPDYVDDVGRGVWTPAQEEEILQKLPAFDPETARAARDHGILVEFLRTSRGVRVNRHPARFVARGPHTERLFSTQPWHFAFGHGSALDHFLALDGKILLLGSDHDAVTFLHYVEHVADIPNRRVAQFKVPVLHNGARVWRDMKEFDTSGRGVHANWPDRFFTVLVDGYLAEAANGGGRVGDAISHLLPVRGLYEYARPIMERTARL